MDRRVWKTSEEESKELVQIVARHVKLAKEAIERGTTPERRVQIGIEISELRQQREVILNKYTN